MTYQRVIELLFHDGGNKEYVLNKVDPLGNILLLPCPVIKLSGKLQLNPEKTTNGPVPSGMKVWVTLLCKEPWPAEVLAEGKLNAEWVVEEEIKYQL